MRWRNRENFWAMVSFLRNIRSIPPKGNWRKQTTCIEDMD
jgi:hypothetical protein